MTDTATLDGATRQDKSTPALEVHGVRKTFEAENAPVRALRGVDLTAEHGTFLALMGPSGCGKSTLLNLVAGLDVPDEGTIKVAGEEVTGSTEDELARHAAAAYRHRLPVFQPARGHDRAGERGPAGRLSRAASAKRPRRGRATCSTCSASATRPSAMPGVLSGGQRQRLAIARALANEPTLLLADEPTGALDSAGGQEVIELLSRLHSGGQTIVLVTHDPDVAAAADTVLRMRDGRILGKDADVSTVMVETVTVIGTL